MADAVVFAYDDSPDDQREAQRIVHDGAVLGSVSDTLVRDTAIPIPIVPNSD